MRGSIAFELLFPIFMTTLLSAGIAAVLVLEVQLAWKVIIVAGFVMLVILWEVAAAGVRAIQKAYLYSRLTFISLEIKRLKPESRETSWDRLSSDLKEERERKEIEDDFWGRKSPPRWLNLVDLVILVAGVCFFYWLLTV